MQRSNDRTGIDIAKELQSEGVSLVRGGIRIDASARPVEARFETTWGRVYMLLDCSGSMAGYKIDQAKRGITDFAADAVRKKYLVGLIKFDTHTTHLSEPTHDTTRLESHMKGIRPAGSTNMAAAIRLAHTMLKALDAPRVIVIATDGQPNNANDAIREGESAKRDGIEIITIGTDDAVQAFLKKLASRTDLGTKVPAEMFAKAISSAHLLLPGPLKMVPTQKQDSTGSGG